METNRKGGLRVKIAAGILGVLLVACLVGGYFLVWRGGAEKALEFTGEIRGAADRAKEVERLNAEFPFMPPEDGSVPEDRLKAYIAVCETIKPAVDAMAQSPGGGPLSLDHAKSAVEARRTLLARYSESLRAHSMSAKEFSWIHNAMQFAKGEATVKADRIADAEPTVSEELPRDPIVVTEPKDPEAPAGEVPFVEDIAAIIGSPSTNALLYSRYAETLKACEWGEEGDFLLHGLGHSQSVRVTVVTEDSPPQDSE